MTDEAARQAALDVARSFIVQAPAGSGKTELLIQRYLGLLATVDDPEEVLAITFTRKAAAEMQLRILQALRQVAAGESPEEPHQQVTAEAAKAVLARDRERQWNLVTNARRMRILTLDALNASIARMQPMSSNSGAANNAIVADAEMRALYRNAATLTLDQLAETGAMHDATEQILLHVDNNTPLYINYVARMLATRDQWLPFVGSGLVDSSDVAALRTRFEENLEGAVRDYLHRTRAVLQKAWAEPMLESGRYAAGQLIADGQTEHAISRLHCLDQFPRAHVECVPQWQALAELLLTRQGQWRKTVTKAQGFPTGDQGQRQVMLDLLESLRDDTAFRDLLSGTHDLPPIRYSDEQWSVLLALFRLLPLAVTELKRLFGDRGISDYTEVALTAAHALGTADDPGDVALLLDYQLRHLLVDEMQDTSSAQYRMLEALTGGWQDGDGRTLFCVGDPMQSIYRFRNAEVGQFLLAKNAGVGGVQLESLTLRRNFRSGQHLVDWFNAVFPDVLATADDATQSAVAYSSAVSVPDLSGQGDCIVHPVFGSDSENEADHGCRVIRDTLAAHPDDDMAVLVRGRSHLQSLLARLRNDGIPYRAVEIDRLTDLPEVIDVLALTRALVHRGDRLAWLAILRAPWAGLDWCDLHALVEGNPSATVWELLESDQQLAKLSSFGSNVAQRLRNRLAAAMRANRVESLRDTIESAWLALGGPAILDDARTVENVYRFLDVIERLEEGGTLTDVAELEAALDLEHVSTDSNARLQIMTMHRAKGLQFDHVLLYGLGRAPGRQERTVLSWFDVPGEHGADEKVISPVGPRAEIENDPLHRFIEKIEATKYRHELGRLLYVACTRARRSLHLLGHVEVTADASEYKQPRAGSLLNLLWSAVADEYSNAFDPSAIPPVSRSVDGWVAPELRRFESDWTLPDFVDLVPADGPADSVDTDREVEFYWVGSAARLAGTIVHRWLQMAADQRVQFDSTNMINSRIITSHWLRGMGIRKASMPVIVDRVEAALNGMLDDKQGRWLLAGDGHSELPLTGVYDGQVTSIVLDRVRIDEQGTHWVIDYKTSSHEGGDLQSFLRSEVARYTPQLQKYITLYRNYSKADVRCALYFPLLQEFVEVSL